jgi:hypothetical protein
VCMPIITFTFFSLIISSAARNQNYSDISSG